MTPICINNKTFVKQTAHTPLHTQTAPYFYASSQRLPSESLSAVKAAKNSRCPSMAS